MSIEAQFSIISGEGIRAEDIFQPVLDSFAFAGHCEQSSDKPISVGFLDVRDCFAEFIPALRDCVTIPPGHCERPKGARQSL